MLISTKGRYAVRVLTDMAEHDGKKQFLRLPGISERQEISLKYLEKIMTTLTKAHLIESAHGKGGGYRLLKEPEEYTILEVLRVTEDTLAPVECLRCNAEACSRKAECRTVGMWEEVDEMLAKYFGNKTIADLMK